MLRTRNGIGSCSGVDESIVEAFFQDNHATAAAGSSSGVDTKCHSKNPLSMLVGFITCLNKGGSQSSSSRRAWEKCKATALLELSKQQQAALADKQDTIDMLEWQLQQLQMATYALGVSNDEDELLKRAQVQDESDPPPVAAAAAAAAPPPPPPPPPSPPVIAATTQTSPPLVLLLEMAVVRARLSMRYFCNLFLKQMEASGYPVCRALAEIEPATTFLRKEHAAYVLDSKINKAFFHCFENESFDGAGITQILDPARRAAAKLHEYRRMAGLDIGDAVNSKSPWFDAEFLRFCQHKTREMWGEFGFSVAFRSVEERDSFTAAFLDVAKAVWLLHRLAFAVNPAVGIIRVGKGTDMDASYVEAVAVPERPCSVCGKAKVAEFLVMPGFRTHSKVIKCQVYPHVQCK